MLTVMITENAETGTDKIGAYANVRFQCHCLNNDESQISCSYLFSHQSIIESNETVITFTCNLLSERFVVQSPALIIAVNIQHYRSSFVIINFDKNSLTFMCIILRVKKCVCMLTPCT